MIPPHFNQMKLQNCVFQHQLVGCVPKCSPKKENYVIFFHAQNFLVKHIYCLETVFNAITKNGAVFKPE